MNSPCRFCTFSTSPLSLNQLISSPYSPWAYSSCAGCVDGANSTAGRRVTDRAAPPSTLEPIRVLDVDVPGLGAAHPDRFAGGHLVPARDALLRALLSASPMVLSLDSDKQSARRLPPSRRADRNDQQPAPRGAAVPRKTKADAAKRCCASSFVSPLDSVVGSLVVRGGQRPNRFASRLMLVGGAGQGSWGLAGVGEGVLGTARLRLCAPWLPFLSRARRRRAVAL